MTTLQRPALHAVLSRLQSAARIDDVAVTRALDAALADGKLAPAERTALHHLLHQKSDAFDEVSTRKRLETLLAIPEDRLAALAHALTRKDGVIDLKDARQLTALLDGGHGKKTVTSLRALMVGVKMTAGAERHLTAEVGAPDAARQSRLAKEPLRTYALEGRAGGVLVPRTGLATVAPPQMAPLHDVKAADLEKALGQAAREREKLLRSGETPATSRVVPEDGTLQVRAFHMAMIGADQTGLTYPRQMAQIGKREGFTVVLRVPVEYVDELRKQFKEEGLRNIHVVGVAGEGDFWSEDQGELDVDGNVRVPAPAPQLDELQEAAYRDRVGRLYPEQAAKIAKTPWSKLRETIAEKFPDAVFSMVGAVSDRKSHEVLAGVALAKGTTIRASLTHIEGGNLLVGTLPSGEGYALVGRDSLAVSRRILEKDRGRKVTDDELKAAVAHDLGVKPEHVHAVEQPRDFHLDMHMVPIKPGEILLNDAVAAAKLQAQWEREDHAQKEPRPPPPGASSDKLEMYQSDLEFWRDIGKDMVQRHADDLKHAERSAKFEKLVAKDLEAAGLKVHLAPAVFGQGHAAVANFLNAEQGTNPRGERFYIALGGDPRAERVFVDALKALDPGIARVHLLDPEMTGTTLRAGGGISCRTKAEGTLAPTA
ncbi:MAG: hypothetical protein AB2A00_37005 [Myxococcota bacterium]